MLARKCLEEMERERREMVGSSWEEERRDFFKVRGMRLEEVEAHREGGEVWFKELEEGDREEQRDRGGWKSQNITNATRG